MLKVLIIDDQPDDVFLTRRALSRCDPAPEVEAVPDGRAAIDYLGDAAERRALPDLVLLDLNLLGDLDGFDVLDFIRGQPVVRRTITVVLTSSSSRSDITRAYEQAANGYLVKPARMHQWIGAMQGLVTMLDTHFSLPHRVV